MKFKPFALLAFVAAVGVAACEDDPAAVLGSPFAISTNVSTVTVNQGVQTTVTAFVVDQNNRRLNGELAAAAATGISIDSTRYIQELSETRFFVRGGGAPVPAPGADLVISGQGLTDTVRVVVN